MKDLKTDIIKILEDDSRTSVKSIATMLGVNEDEVHKAMEALEKDKVLLKYTVVANREKLEDGVMAIIEVKVTPQRDLGFDSFAKRIYRFEEVISAYLVSGDYDFMVLVRGSNMQQIANFVYEKLAVLDYVISTSTHFILRSYKENGVIMFDDESAKRLAVTP